jgi:hypothetical protein
MLKLSESNCQKLEREFPADQVHEDFYKLIREWINNDFLKNSKKVDSKGREK